MNSLKEAVSMARETLMFLPLIVFCFLPVRCKIKDSLKRLAIKVILTIAAMELAMFGIYLLLPSEFAVIFNMLFCGVFFFLLYQKEVALELSRLLFIYMTACLIGGFGYLIYHVADIFLNPVGTKQPYSSLNILLIQIGFECILIAILYYPTKKYLRWLVINFHEEKIWRISWIFPFAITIVFRYFVPYDNSNMYIGRTLTLYIIALIIFLLVTVSLYVMFYQIAYSIVKYQQITVRTVYLEMQAEQYRRLQAYVQETSRIRHDFRHQLTVLNTMLQNQEYEEAKQFLNEYCVEVFYTAKCYCVSPAINAVLNHYVSLCQEEKITVRFSVSLNDEIAVKDIDFCVLLGNLLENALHGCKSADIDHGEIELKIKQTTPHVIVLQIRNPYTNTIQRDGEKFLSTKHKGEGMGLKSIGLITEKYKGFMKVEYDDQQFLVKVLLNV